MNKLIDRFKEYWSTDNTYEMTIFEMIVYGLIGVVLTILYLVSILIMLPIIGIVSIPYSIYKLVRQCHRRRESKSHHEL